MTVVALDTRRSAELGLGVKETARELAAGWEATARRWGERKPPWRPSAGDVDVYRRLAGERLGGRVLLLGVTPELRDLVASAGGSLVLTDASAAMYEVTTRMLRLADPSQETWVRREWGPFPFGDFDLVLGDLIWWVVSVAKQYEVRDAIHAALKPSGLFVGRMRFCDSSRAAASPARAVARSLAELDAAPGEADRIEEELVSWLYDHTANRALRRLDRDRAHAFLGSLAERPEFAGHEERLRRLAGRAHGVDWTSQTRKELLRIVRRHFEVVGEAHAEDYDSTLYPVFACKPA